MAGAVHTEQAVIDGPPAATQTRERGGAAQADETRSPLTEIPEAGLFVLPGGYVGDDGVNHSEVELSPVTGREEDLLTDVPPHTCTASAITCLLSCCLKRVGSLSPVPVLVVRDLLVGDREYLIVKLREMTFGPQVDAVIGCANALCGRPMDIAFSLANLGLERRPVTQRFFAQRLSPTVMSREGDAAQGAAEMEFRLPTGADQEILAPLFQADETRAVNQLLARCVRRIGACTQIDEATIARLSEDTRREIEAGMERLAPQVAIELDLICPECQTAFVTAFDFTAFFLAEMKANLRHLEREVHLLAWHYHWSEREILSLTRKRRQRYIKLVDEELERLS